MSVNRWGVSGLIVTKVADIVSTGYALTAHPHAFAEANGLVAQAMHAIGVWPAMLVLGTVATLWIVSAAEYFAGAGYPRLRSVTYAGVTLLWGVVAMRNVWLLAVV